MSRKERLDDIWNSVPAEEYRKLQAENEAYRGSYARVLLDLADREWKLLALRDGNKRLAEELARLRAAARAVMDCYEHGCVDSWALDPYDGPEAFQQLKEALTR